VIFYGLGLKQGALSLCFFTPPLCCLFSSSPHPLLCFSHALLTPTHFIFVATTTLHHHRLDKGEVAEFDHPHVLLQKQGGTFAKLVDELGESSAASLKATAKETFGKRKEL
jgi:hypothetical protein